MIMTLHWAFIVMLLGLLFWISYSDISDGLIRNTHNLALAALGVADCLLQEKSMIAAVVGAGLGAGVLIVGNLLYWRVRKTLGFGYGDIKFMMGAGIWVSWTWIAPLLLIASTLALIVNLKNGLNERNRQIRFGPYLCFALLLVIGLQETHLAEWWLA